jgi:lysyl-tRNA synthetase class 2
MSGHWRPSAELEVLRARAEMLSRIRAFFLDAGVLEVETPLAGAAANTDPMLDSLATRYTGPGAAGGRRLYLQTSPEFAMKRLLAVGSGPIYQICKAFRDGERGRLHNPEFSILEWYRPGYDHHQLMDEVEALVAPLLGVEAAFERRSYAELFQHHLGLDPLAAGVSRLRQCALECGGAGLAELELDADAWLDLLLSEFIEPRLGRGRPCFVYDYPAGKAALARVRPGPPPLASRFELYAEGLELANGFHELSDAAEQQRRFEAELQRRRQAGRTLVPMDLNLLAALQRGLPDSAGVALGLDRLLMLQQGLSHIDEALAFPLERA